MKHFRDIQIQGASNFFTKVELNNFGCDWSFRMKFGILLDMVYKFFHKKFVVCSPKNAGVIMKNLFFQCFHTLGSLSLMIYQSLVLSYLKKKRRRNV